MSRAFSNNDNSIIIANSFNRTAPDDSKILARLSPLEPWVRQRDIGAQRVDGIGDWLLETREFRRWYSGGREDESDHATLFCDGDPGVGKSFITSIVIDKLCDEAEEEEDAAVVCFYFDFASRNEQSPINMLGSLLRQLVSGLEQIPEVVIQDFRKQKKVIGGRGLQVSGVLKMFQTIAATKRTYICVDALDECVPGHRMIVLETLGQILRGSPNTRLFMTGRPHVRSEVERKLGRAAAFVFIQPTEDGVFRFLRERIRNDTAPHIMSPTLEADVMKSILKLGSETFLLASLHIEAILRETTIARRGKRLKSVKDGAGLGDAYGVTLERIKAQGGERARLAIVTLSWICHSERLLQVDELCYALGVEIGGEDFDPENVPSISTLLDCCQGLITVDKEASTVRLIHFTVQEYLCAYPGLFSKPHATIAEACLTYLNSQRVKNLAAHPLPDHQSIPFLKYSSRYWGTHAKRELSGHARTLALELLNQYEDHVSALSLLKQVLHPSKAGVVETSQLFSGLHCASFFGIVELVTALVNTEGCEINQQDCIARTPLLWAAKYGHEPVVKLLLEREGVDPDRRDDQDSSPLSWAANNGHGGVAELLLKQENVDPNCPDEDGRTPLGCAAFEGHEAVVKLLLERENVDPDRPDYQDNTPLSWAANNGHEGVVKLLLERGNVDPNRPDENDRTPLGCAAFGGHKGVVKLLLERENVDPNRPDEDGRTPLGCAAFEGHEGVVRLLLEQENVDPNYPDKDAGTPLTLAAFKGREGVVKLLLERENVDPNLPDENDRTPLGCAAFEGHEGVVELLLQREDVDPNLPDEGDRTPLWCAAVEGHEGVARLLLEQENVDPNRPDKDGWTPVGCAAVKGHKGMVELLLGREGVDPHRPNKHGGTPLASAYREGHGGVVRLLRAREFVESGHA